MKTILVIGGSGFIGRNIIEAYLSKGVKLIVLSKSYPSWLNEIKSQVTVLEGKLDNKSLIENTVKEYSVDLVLHLASSLIPSSNFSDFQNEMSNVIEPTFWLVNMLAERGIKLLYFSSGGTVYGNSSKSEICESEPLFPINYYGLSKVMIENYIQFAGSSLSLNYLILRPSNVFGRYQPQDRPQGFISVALSNLLSGEKLTVYGNGDIIRDFIDVQDLTFLTLKLIEKGVKNRVLNIGSGVGNSLNEIISILEKELNKKMYVEYMPERAVDAKKVVLDISKLNQIISFKPKELELGIRDIINKEACL